MLNNSSQKKIRVHLVCNAHIDPIWIWNLDEGIGVTLSTFRCAADFCEEFDGFVFNHNESLLYEWVEEYEPELFERIKRLVTEGRWAIMGGWFLQPDCNMPSGEGIVRQILRGRQYFMEKFGEFPRCAMNVDSFGHTRGLAQIIARSGQDGYLVCRPSQRFLPLEHNQFRWRGLDGSEVIVSRIQERYCNNLGEAGEKIRTSIRRLHGESASDMMGDVGGGQLQGGSMLRAPHTVLWGVGNHGGGPSRQDLREIAKAIDELPEAEIFHSTLEQYFTELEERRGELPVLDVDLNPWAPGCYTSMASVKKACRDLESALWLTERMAAHAVISGAMREWPAGSFREAERCLLLLQFHDVLPGTGTREVEDASVAAAGRGIDLLAEVRTRAFFALSSGQEASPEGEIPILVYNPFPHEVVTEVDCEYNLEAHNFSESWTVGEAYDSAGKRLPSQMAQEHSYINVDWRKRIVFRATLAPMTMNRFQVRNRRLESRPPKIAEQRDDEAFVFENDALRVEFDRDAGLVRSVSRAGEEYLGGLLFEPVLFADDQDPWSVSATRYEPTGDKFRLMNAEASAAYSGSSRDSLPPMRVIEAGEVRVVVESTFQHGFSRMLQRVAIPRFGNHIDVTVKVDWQERNRLLKLKVPFEKRSEDIRLSGQTMFGSVELATDGRENVSQQWLAIEDRESGIALGVINDRIYGSSYTSGDLYLSLLRGTAYAAHPVFTRQVVPDDEYVEHMDLGEHSFRFRIVFASTRDEIDGIDRRAAEFNQLPVALNYFPSGGGQLPAPGARIDNPSVNLVTVKRAENNKGWIYRLHNPTRVEQALSLRMVGEKSVERVLRPFQVTTLLGCENGEVHDVSLMEEG